MRTNLGMLALSKQLFIYIVISFVASGCAMLQTKPEQTNTRPPKVGPTLSSSPLTTASEIDKKFAQAALKQMGFNVGYVDGIWGPRSAKAIRLFEQTYRLPSANGHLSELNLAKLSEFSTVRREQIVTNNTKKKRKQGLAKKINKNVPLNKAPQLVITDRDYSILTKPNPYSEVVTQITAGSGIYVIAFQDGWYKVESLNRQTGYIKE